MGIVIGAIAAPMLLQPPMNWVILQGTPARHYVEDDGEHAQDDEDGEEDGQSQGASTEPPSPAHSPPPILSPKMTQRVLKSAEVSTASPQPQSLIKRFSNVFPTNSPTLEELHRGKAFSFGRFVEKASEIFQDAPSGKKTPVEMLQQFVEEQGEEGISERSKQLMNSHYFHSEMQFVLALVDISNRLCDVPRPARQSSLEAELTLLNHNLPADVCVPLWCPANATHPYHHQVVRISPRDSVVLNSADRVPYVLFVEVIESDTKTDIQELREQSKLHEKRTKQGHRPRMPSVNIDLDDTDELFGGTIYKQQKINKEREKRIKKLQNEQLESLDIGRLLTNEEESASDTATEAPSTVTAQDEPAEIRPKLYVPDIHPLASHAAPMNAYHNSVVMRRRSSQGQDEFAERMRTAAVMLAQLAQASRKDGVKTTLIHVKTDETAPVKSKTLADDIREKIIKEMMALEEKRQLRMKLEGFGSGVGGSGGEGGGGEILENEPQLLSALKKDKEDPSAAVFRESWEMKRQRIKASSPFGQHPNWRLLSVIVKTGADLRQEQLACQMIREMQRIWDEAQVNVWVKYFRIMVMSDNSGFIETIKNSISIHSLKKDGYARQLNQRGLVYTLYDHFINEYGEPGSEEFLRAQDNFMRSLAAYSVVSYVLQLKDRHNGNVLIDTQGHLIHIDFGFMLSNSPGSVGFEMAPFKLPQEYLDVLGGIDSDRFQEFKTLVKKAFLAVRKSAENLILLIEMMQKDSRLPALQATDVVSAMRERFQPTLNETQVEDFVEKLIISSCCNVFTRLYDTFQYYSNGIL
jgi:phosphatidylinositol 4-kinase